MFGIRLENICFGSIATACALGTYLYFEPTTLLGRVAALAAGTFAGSQVALATSSCLKKAKKMVCKFADSVARVKNTTQQIREYRKLNSLAKFNSHFDTINRVDSAFISPIIKRDVSEIIAQIIKSGMTLEKPELQEIFDKEFPDINEMTAQIVENLINYHKKEGACTGWVISLVLSMKKNSSTTKENFNEFLTQRNCTNALALQFYTWMLWEGCGSLVPQKEVDRFTAFDEKHHPKAESLFDNRLHIARTKIIDRPSIMKKFIFDHFSQEILITDKEIRKRLTLDSIREVIRSNPGKQMMLKITFPFPVIHAGHSLYCSSDKNEISFFDSNGVFFSFSDEETAARAIYCHLSLAIPDTVIFLESITLFE